MTSRWRVLAPALLVGLALALRLASIGLDGGYEPRHDSYDYDRHARSIAAGGGFPETIYLPDGGPTAVRAPGYPYALGLAYALPGPDLAMGRILGALLGAAAVFALYALTARIWGRRVGLVAGVLAAVYPPLIDLSTELYSENLFIVLLLLSAYCVLRCRESASLRWAAMAGLVFGAAALTRGPGVIALIPILIGLWFLRPQITARSMSLPLVALSCAIVAMSPWIARNFAEFGALVPITTSSGYGLAGTYNDESADDQDAPGGWRNPVSVAAYRPYFERTGIDEVELDSELSAAARDLMIDDPLYVLEVAAHNLLRLTYLEGGSVVAAEGEVDQRGIGNERRPLDQAAFAIAAALAVVGLIAIIRSHRRRDRGNPARMTRMIPMGPLFLWLIPLSLVLVALPVAGLPRYRVPADPFLLILAAIGLTVIWSEVSQRAPSAIAKLRPHRAPSSRGPGRRTAAAAALAVVAVVAGGCGGGEEPVGSTTTSDVPDPAAVAAKRVFIKRGDRICARANEQIQAIIAGLSTQSGGPLTVTTEGIVRPGIAVRARQADALLALEPPPGEDPNLNEFLGLFAAIDEVSRQRLRAGAEEDPTEALRLELLAQDLGKEQQQAARAYGFEDCAADVLGEAFS